MDPLKNRKAKPMLLITLLAIILVMSSPVVNSVLVNLINPTETAPLSSSSANLSVGPWPAGYLGPAIVDDTLQPTNTATFHVNVTGASDLFTWQINMTWDPSILNASNINPGDFLALSANDTSSEALGVVINATDNAEGYSSMAESILANVSGITGGGRLVSIEFLVVGYGSTDLNISISGTLPTMLLNSTGDSMAFTTTLVLPYYTAGYFRNKYPGDIVPDYYVVDYDDYLAFLGTWLKTAAAPGYNREADFDYTGSVDYDDYLVFLANWLKTFP